MLVAIKPAAATAWPADPMTVGDMAPLTEIVEGVVGGTWQGDSCQPVHRSPQEISIIGRLYSMGLVAIETGEDEIGRQILGAGNAGAAQGVGWPENLGSINGVAISKAMLIAGGCRPVNGIIGSYRVGMAIQAEGIVIRSCGPLHLW